MNKIFIVDDEIIEKSIDDSLEVNFIPKSDTFGINNIKIEVKKSTTLNIDYDATNDNKLDLSIVVNDGTCLDLFELKNGANNKIKYEYILNDNSSINVTKFYDCNSVREVDIINLNGVNSTINYNLRTISKNREKYDIVVYHNRELSNSNIDNAGVNIKDGSLIFNVTSVVDNGIKNCNLNQNSHIITFNNNECSINPNLLIDENDVCANHSANIGRFDDNKIFYLMRLGIPIDEAYKLLIKGFLLNKIDTNYNSEKIDNIFNKYWG